RYRSTRWRRFLHRCPERRGQFVNVRGRLLLSLRKAGGRLAGAAQPLADFAECCPLCSRQGAGPRTLAMLGKPDDLVARQILGKAGDADRRLLAQKGVGLGYFFRGWSLRHLRGFLHLDFRRRLGSTEHGADRFFVLFRLTQPDDSKAAETFENAAPAVDRQSRQVDRYLEVGARERPLHSAARPGVAVFEEARDGAIGIQPESIGDL